MKISRLLLLGVLLSSVAMAQTSVVAKLNWKAPAKAEDGSALTGEQAINAYQVYVATASIPDATTAAPTFTTDGATLARNQAVTLSVGQTMYVRVRACNKSGCGALSPEMSKRYAGSVPGAAALISVEIG